MLPQVTGRETAVECSPVQPLEETVSLVFKQSQQFFHPLAATHLQTKTGGGLTHPLVCFFFPPEESFRGIIIIHQQPQK